MVEIGTSTIEEPRRLYDTLLTLLKILDGDFSGLRHDTLKCNAALTIIALTNEVRLQRVVTAFKQFIMTGETEITVPIWKKLFYKVSIPSGVAKRKEELQQLCKYMLEMTDRAIVLDVSEFIDKYLGINTISLYKALIMEEKDRILIEDKRLIENKLYEEKKYEREKLREITHRKNEVRINKIISAFREYLRVNERTKDEVVEILRAGLPHMRLSKFGNVNIYASIKEALNIPGLSLKEIIKVFGKGNINIYCIAGDGKVANGSKIRAKGCRNKRVAVIPFEVFIKKLYEEVSPKRNPLGFPYL